MTKEPDRKRMKRSSSVSLESATAAVDSLEVGRGGPAGAGSSSVNGDDASHVPFLVANEQIPESNSVRQTTSLTQDCKNGSHFTPHTTSSTTLDNKCFTTETRNNEKENLSRKRAADVMLESDVPVAESKRTLITDSATSSLAALPNSCDSQNGSNGCNRLSLNESTNLVNHIASGVSDSDAVVAPVALISNSSSSLVDTKETKGMASRKKCVNLSAKYVQAGLEKIILSLGQLNGRDLPKSKLCMLQMCILLHSAYCKKLTDCPVPQCRVIMDVLSHMTRCTENQKCQVRHCTASKQLIGHWKLCANIQCDTCKTILDAVMISSNEVDRNATTVSELSQSSFGTDFNISTDSPRDDVPRPTSRSGLYGEGTVPTSDASPKIDVIGVGQQQLHVTQSLATNGDSDSLKTNGTQPLPVWEAPQLVQSLKPILDKLWNLGKASQPFQKPVDPCYDQCPDYFQVIKNPMDLGTIRKKLFQGIYKNAREFVNDVYLMLKNAWTYNHRNSIYYKYALKLANAFEESIDDIMHRLGYCCGRKYEYTPLVMYCDTMNSCAIKPYSTYYMAENCYSICEDCYANSTGVVVLIDETTQKNVLKPKTLFKRERNVYQPPEEDVTCRKCGRVFHSVCVLYLPELWPQGYICKACAIFYSINYFRNKFSSRTVPETFLSQSLEERVNTYLTRRGFENAGVRIRVLASSSQETTVLPKFKQHFQDTANSYSYTAKAIYAFQERDGDDVCFFSLHVQEYSSDAQNPNSRCVYLAYLDSVNFFTPSHCRTGVYYEILLGYMAYVKKRGFLKMFIWSCPPSPGDDYIFYCHPLAQKTPKPKRLHEWYRSLLDRGVRERTISSYKDMEAFVLENNLKSAKELPYFSGDYWPSLLEELLGELDHKSNSGKAADDRGVDPLQLYKPKKKKGYKPKGTKTRRTQEVFLSDEEALMEKLYSSMKKHKEMYFVIEFYPQKDVASLPLIADKDPLTPNELLNSRSTFLLFARNQHYEFSSLRRAKFSTQAMLFEYDRHSSLGVVCDNCSISVGNSRGLLFCRTCENIKLCLACYDQLGHPHTMHQMWNSTELHNRRSDLQCLAKDLEHAAICSQQSCLERNCSRFKTAMAHMHDCSRKNQPIQKCKSCSCLIFIVYLHARRCVEANCPIVFCNRVKQKQNELQSSQREYEARIMRRRMHQMANEDLANEKTETSDGQADQDEAADVDEVVRGKGSCEMSNSKTNEQTTSVRHLDSVPDK